jgi:hypothetical protein
LQIVFDNIQLTYLLLALLFDGRLGFLYKTLCTTLVKLNFSGIGAVELTSSQVNLVELTFAQ